MFQVTEQNGECQHTYELSDDLLTELANREIESVRVLIKEPLTIIPREFDELLKKSPTANK